MLICSDDANIDIVICDTVAVTGQSLAGKEEILWEIGLCLQLMIKI